MKSIACISSSVRAACHHTSSACFPLNRALTMCTPVGRCSKEDLSSRTVVAQQPCVTAAVPVRTFHGTRVNTAVVHQMSAAHFPKPGPLLPRKKDDELTLCQFSRPVPMDKTSSPVPHMSPYSPFIKPKGSEAALVNANVLRLRNEYLDCVGFAEEEDTLSPGEAARVYSLLALCYDAASQQQALMLSTLNRRTQRLVHRLKASQVSNILQALSKLPQREAISLVLRLSNRASRVFKAFSDDEVIKVLSALAIMGQHDEELLAAMEKHLPGRLGKCDPELSSTVMEYCLQMRCRSEPIFEAVAENFVCNAERHSTLQIAKQIVAMGRLNYLPQCSSHMFKKLESILSTRFSHFQPRSLIEVLHACIHLERFPLNYMSRVFSPHFLQRLQAQGEPLDKNALGQLTQLHLATSLECTHYWGPRLPYFFHVKKFYTVDQAFETPMESLLYKRVKGPLTQLLGGNLYSTKVSTHCGYTIDVEICLDENGYILPLSEWDHTYRRMALFLDGENRFCNNTHHLLGKEATKRRHVRRMGYEVVQIPYFEFEKLRSQEEQVQYLHNKIFPTIFKFNHTCSTRDSSETLIG